MPNPPRSVLLPVLVLFSVNILNFYDRNLAGALLEPIRREFSLSDAQVGLLGTAFIWVYALVGLPLGFLADRWSRKKLLALGVILWTAMTALAGLANSFSVLLISRLGVGVGEAVCAPAGTSWLGDLVPPHRRARLLGLFMLGVPIGSALSYFLSGPLAQAYGWRTAMVVAALPALVLVPALLLLPEPVHGATESTPSVRSLSAVLRQPTLWWIIASGVFLNFNIYAISMFLPGLLARVHHFSLSQAGTAAGLTSLVGGLAGVLLAGYWGDRFPHRRLAIAAAASALGAPFAYLGVVQTAGHAALALFGLAIAYGALNAYYGLVYAAIQALVAPHQRGLIMAFYFLVMYLCGGSFGPLLTGMLSDRLARQAMQAAGAVELTEAFKALGLQQAMLVLPVLSLALAAVLAAAAWTNPATPPQSPAPPAEPAPPRQSES